MWSLRIFYLQLFIKTKRLKLSQLFRLLNKLQFFFVISICNYFFQEKIFLWLLFKSLLGFLVYNRHKILIILLLTEETFKTCRILCFAKYFFFRKSIGRERIIKFLYGISLRVYFAQKLREICPHIKISVNLI